MSKFGVIYKYTSPSGKVYVGQTVHELTRKRQHKMYAKNLNNDTKFYRAIRKYGFDAFEYEVIVGNVPRELLDDLEINCIAMEDSYYTGYNSTLGGSSGEVSKATRKKISNTLQGRVLTEEHRLNIIQALTGRVVSESTRKKIGDSHRGKAISPQQLEQIYKSKDSYIVTTPTGEEFIILREFKNWCKERNLECSNLRKVAKGERKQHKGYIAKFYKENDDV